MSSLLTFLKRYIQKNGPITVADYMQFALNHPDYGYYTTHSNPIGSTGDFTTAPEVSQIFGELISIWFLYVWQHCCKDQSIDFVELGPGRGTILSDILRVWQKLDPIFLEKIKIHLVESHPQLQTMQSEKLKNLHVHWHRKWPHLSGSPTFILANEFFDVFPIRQLVCQQGKWHEKLVAWDEENEKLCFVVNNLPIQAQNLIPKDLDKKLQEGAMFEISPAAWLYLQTLLDHLKATKGVLLIIDYGSDTWVTEPTLQAIKQHCHWPVLQDPGEVDLSAHVVFKSLQEIARQSGAQCFGPVTQGEWLSDMGVAYRLQQLIKNNPCKQQDLEQAVHRLCHPEQMGSLFKVMAVGYDLPEQLPGFIGG